MTNLFNTKLLLTIVALLGVIAIAARRYNAEHEAGDAYRQQLKNIPASAYGVGAVEKSLRPSRR